MTGKQLCEAARDGDAAKVSTLLSTQGAQSFINYQDVLGVTPLHEAVFKGLAAVTEKLIAARCNVDLRRRNGSTPLLDAARDGYEAVTKQLIAARCSVDLQDKFGCTALHAATENGRDAVTDQLIAARCNVDLQDENGSTALREAAAKGHAAIAEQLIASRCKVDLQDNYGCTPLHVAAQSGHEAVTKQLIAARCNVDFQDGNGCTPLYFAAGYGHEAVMEILLAARCNVDLQTNTGGTPLHIAAIDRREDVTKQLIAARCNVDLQAKNGLTALQAAEAMGHAGIASLIRNNKHKSADRGKKDTLLQASPEEIKKQQEDADRAMKELLEEEDKDVAAAAAVSQKKRQAKKAGKERRDAADRQDGRQKEEHAEEQKDTERTEAKAVSEKNKTESVAAVAVAAALKDKAEERGGQVEEGGKQGTAERKKAEGAGTSQGIQGRGLSQEKDDDGGLSDESPAKRKSKSKKKKAGDQRASASKTAPWATEAKEAGAAAAGVGVEAKSWPPPLQADVEQAAKSLMPGAAAPCEGEKLFMAKFNLSRSDTSSEEVPMAGSSTALGPAAVPEEAPASAASMSRAAPAAGGAGPRFTYQSLSIATNNFEKRLGGGGCGSVFQGVLGSGTLVAVKRLELGVAAGAGAAGLSMPDQMRTEVGVLSQVHHVNIVPLLGWSKDGMAPCLVYALMEGGSLQDRLACRGSGALVPLTANERIVVLSDVARGLDYLHSEVRVIHRNVKSANVLLDRGCLGRIGDFGIARSLNDNHSGITATHMHTEHVMGTQVYMAPEYKNGELSTKVDAFAFGLVVLETLTGYAVCSPAPGHRNLLSMFQDELDTADNLVAHLDKRACWDQHKQERIASLFAIADRCLEARRKKRPELVELIPELEEVRRGTEALPADVHPRAPNYMDSFHCPLTLEVMRDPVITADGQTYERAEIESWFALGKRTSPLTGAELPSTHVTPNIALRHAIQESGLLN